MMMMSIHSSSRIAALLLLLLVHFEFCHGFSIGAPSYVLSHKQQQQQQSRRHSSVSSEWYSPPPEMDLQSSSSSTTTTTTANNNKPIITEITSHIDWVEFLASHDGDDSLCVVKFHAAWCKSCQKFGRLMDQYCRKEQQNSDTSSRNSMRYASVEFGAHNALCRSLGIRRLPTVQIYHQGDLVQSFACAPSKFHSHFVSQLAYLRELDEPGLARQKEEMQNAAEQPHPAVEQKVQQWQEQQQQQQDPLAREESQLAHTLSQGEALIKEHVVDRQEATLAAPEESSGDSVTAAAAEHKRRWWKVFGTDAAQQ